MRAAELMTSLVDAVEIVAPAKLVGAAAPDAGDELVGAMTRAELVVGAAAGTTLGLEEVWDVVFGTGSDATSSKPSDVRPTGGPGRMDLCRSSSK